MVKYISGFGWPVYSAISSHSRARVSEMVNSSWGLSSTSLMAISVAQRFTDFSPSKTMAWRMDSTSWAGQRRPS